MLLEFEELSTTQEISLDLGSCEGTPEEQVMSTAPQPHEEVQEVQSVIAAEELLSIWDDWDLGQLEGACDI